MQLFIQIDSLIKEPEMFSSLIAPDDSNNSCQQKQTDLSAVTKLQLCSSAGKMPVFHNFPTEPRFQSVLQTVLAAGL